MSESYSLLLKVLGARAKVIGEVVRLVVKVAGARLHVVLEVASALLNVVLDIARGVVGLLRGLGRHVAEVCVCGYDVDFGGMNVRKCTDGINGLQEDVDED